MPTPSGKIKQETVNGRTVTVHQLRNKFPDIEETPYMYEIRVDGNPVGDPVFMRNVAMSEFEATVSGFERFEGGQGHDAHGGEGLFGGGLF